jgi:hypothetical protein
VRETPLPQIARQNGLLPICPLSESVYNRFSQAYLRLLIGEIGGNSTKRPFRLPLDIATKLEKWIQSSNTAGSLPDLAITKTIDEVIVYPSDCMWV